MHKLGISSEFIRRRSKLKSYMFLEALVFNQLNFQECSLRDITDYLYMNYNLRISKQSIDERFNGYSVEFMKIVLEKLITKNFINNENSLLFSQFNRVLIKDSTAFELPEHLAYKYPGNGGKTSTACAKIQYEFDLKTGKTNELVITSKSINDYSNARETIDKVKPGDLIIRDLGYSSLSCLQAIDKAGGYFLNRLKPDTAIFVKQNNQFIRIGLKTLKDELELSKKTFITKRIYAGCNRYIPMKIIIMKVPNENLENKLIRQLGKTKRRCCKKSNKEIIKNIDLNILVTNIPDCMIASKDLYKVYKLRWQIELTFKVWKSIFKINRIKKTKVSRVETNLYAQLILIFINWEIISSLAQHILKTINKSISYFKASRTLIQCKSKIREYLHQPKKLADFFKMLFSKFIHSHLIEKRKNKICSVEILNQFVT